MIIKSIVFLDKWDFSYQDIDEKPLAGAESAFIELVKAFARLGYHVSVRNHCAKGYKDVSIDWQNLSTTKVPDGDFYIVNRTAALLSLVPKGKKVFFWLHNHGKYLLRLSSLKLLFRYYPILVFSGKYHRSSLAIWFLFRYRIIPYGIGTIFLSAERSDSAPGPKVIFTSNPLRSLDWIVDRWKIISARVPGAELHVFSGPTTYGTWGSQVASRMERILDYVRASGKYGVILREPLQKNKLIAEIKTSRAMLYRGDKAETFCLAVAEVQAMGIPCVVQNFGSMRERVMDQKTGFVTSSDKKFEEMAVQVLTDDNVWKKMNATLIEGKYYSTWEQSAQLFIL